eukprot:c23334_g1_i2 orf=723-3173(+)
MDRSISLGVPRSDANARHDFSALRRWLVAFCAIRFDLEQGQVLEECYPSGSVSTEEEYDIAFSSFPDSMSQAHNRSSVHDCMFFFRIRRRGSLFIDAQNTSVRRSVSLAMPECDTESSLTEVRESGIEETAGSQVRSIKGDASISIRNAGGPLLDQEHGLGNVEVLHRRVSSESGSTLLSGMVDLFLDKQQAGGRRGSLPISRIVTSMLSPRPRPRNSGVYQVESYHEGKPGGPRQTSQEIARSGSRGGPGSGGPRYLYGFVFNRQRKDERLRRGGEQKSVVILSERPYSSVFRSLLQILGPLYFDIGGQALEQVAACVSQWPNPEHGALMELSVGNVTLRTHIPPAHTLPPGCGTPMDDFTSAMAPVSPLNPSIPQGVFHEADIFGIFRGVLMQLWVLWELVLVGEPLLVIAPTPSQCCEAVAALVGLVAPLPCSVDFRPYFTIHDPDFSFLNSLKDGDQVPPMILGVTNLFFLKSLRNLPHVISVGSSLATSNRLRLLTRSMPNGSSSNLGQLQLSPLKKFSPTNLLKVARMRRDGPLCLMTEHREAVWSKFVPTTKPDTAVLNRLVDAGMSPRTEESISVVNNEILHRHFLELTTNFLAPFGPYLRATTPPEGASPFADPPPLPPFDAHDFLEGLAARGPGKFLSKRLCANWLDLYRRFLKGSNFMPWFQRRYAVAEQEQHRIWRQARAKADVRAFLSRMSEVEVINSFNAVERHLLAEIQLLQRAGLASTDSSVCQKLQGDLRTIFNVLPKDMQQLLLFNPQRAALLQGSREFTKLPGRPSVKLAKDVKSTTTETKTQDLSCDPLELERTII